MTDKHLIIILCLLVVIVIGIAGYLIYQDGIAGWVLLLAMAYLLWQGIRRSR